MIMSDLLKANKLVEESGCNLTSSVPKAHVFNHYPTPSHLIFFR